MALTKLNALGSAIRQKVGEAEKKTLPQLKDIVDNQLAYPQNELNVTTNGTYDVKSYASVNVATDERTEEDVVNQILATDLNNYWLAQTNLIGNQGFWNYFRSISTNPGYVNTQNAANFTNLLFQNNVMNELKINVSSATNLALAFDQCSLKRLTLVGSTSKVTSMESLFFGAYDLEIVDGDPIDFSSCTNTTNFGYLATSLKEIRFAQNTLKKELRLDGSAVLSKNSILSALYATTQLEAWTTKPSIRFNSAIDDSDSDIQTAITYAVNNGFIVSIGGHTHQ